MAQKIVTSLLYDGAIRVHAIDTVGRRKGRIIEVEVVATRERLHGSAQRLQRLVNMLRGSCGEELDQVPVWTRGKTS